MTSSTSRPRHQKLLDRNRTLLVTSIDGGESVTVVADRMGHKNATETLHTYSHLWPSSDDKTRRVLETAFAAGHSLNAGRA
jgi:integrase